MSHPDFRVGGRIFATLGYPDEEWGMIKLTQEEQRSFVRADPAALAFPSRAEARSLILIAPPCPRITLFCFAFGTM